MNEFEQDRGMEDTAELVTSYLDAESIPKPPEVERREFLATVRAGTPHAVMTGFLAIGCAIVFVVMTVRGISPIAPSGADGYRYGANFGPALVVDHEWWRLLTCQFVHFGLIHIAFNLWCLLSLGPLVERLYGSPFFLALYLLSGVGGALLSLTVNPMIIGAGASGAIFGVIGGLAAFLLIHRHAIPATTLKSLRGSVVGFVGYNLLIGAMTPNIDNAAHIGGLVTGFVVGLVVQRPWPVTQPYRAVIRRLVGLLVSTALLYVAGSFAVRSAAGNPKVAAVQWKKDDHQVAVEAYNRFVRDIEASARNSDQLSGELDAVLQGVADEKLGEAEAVADLQRVQASATRDLNRMKGLTLGHAGLTPIRQALVDSQQALVDATAVALEVIATSDEKRVEELMKRYNADAERKAEAAKRFAETIQSFAVSNNMRLQTK